MRIKLLVQSLFPLFLFTIIRNINFNTEENDIKMTVIDFIGYYFVLFICILWMIFSLIFFLQFKAFTKSGKTGGYQVKNIKKDEETSLNFFVTIILPLLVSDLNKIQGVIQFAILVFLILMLLYKTNLFFYNPILCILGYHFYEFEFVDNKECVGRYIGISQNHISDEMVCEYKPITEKVFYIIGESNGKRKN